MHFRAEYVEFYVPSCLSNSLLVWQCVWIKTPCYKQLILAHRLTVLIENSTGSYKRLYPVDRLIVINNSEFFLKSRQRLCWQSYLLWWQVDIILVSKHWWRFQIHSDTSIRRHSIWTIQRLLLFVCLFFVHFYPLPHCPTGFPTTQATHHPRSLHVPYTPHFLSCILHQICTLSWPPVLYRYPIKYLVCLSLPFLLVIHIYYVVTVLKVRAST